MKRYRLRNLAGAKPGHPRFMELIFKAVTRVYRELLLPDGPSHLTNQSFLIALQSGELWEGFWTNSIR